MSNYEKEASLLKSVEKVQEVLSENICITDRKNYAVVKLKALKNVGKTKKSSFL